MGDFIYNQKHFLCLIADTFVNVFLALLLEHEFQTILESISPFFKNNPPLTFMISVLTVAIVTFILCDYLPEKEHDFIMRRIWMKNCCSDCCFHCCNYCCKTFIMEPIDDCVGIGGNDFEMKMAQPTKRHHGSRDRTQGLIDHDH